MTRRYSQGQNIVQAGGNSGGGFNALVNLVSRGYDRKIRLAEREHNRREDLNSRKELITHQTNEKLRGTLTEGLMSPHIMGNIFDYANQTYGEEHEDVKSGKRKSTDYLRPDLQHLVSSYGVVSTKNGILPGTPGKTVTHIGTATTPESNVPSKESKVDTSSIIASSPVGGNAPRENDIEMALSKHNVPITFGFESSVGSSGKWSPTEFNADQTPVYSEINAEQSAEDIKNTPGPKQRAGMAEDFARTSNLYAGQEDGKK